MSVQSYKTRAISIIFISLVTMVLVMGLGYVGIQSITHSKERWHSYTQVSHGVVVQTYEIERHFGYGGFIHNFTNFVLQQDLELAHVVESDLKETYLAIEHFKQALAPYAGLNIEDTTEYQALDQIRAVVDQYAKQFNLARNMIAQGKSHLEVDALVSVDDAPALNALKVLREHNILHRQEQAEQVERSMQTSLETLYVGSAIIPVVLFLTFGLIAFLRDITRTNQRLQETTEQLDRMIDEAPDSILVVNQGGIIQRANIEAVDLLGYSREEFDGMAIETLIPVRFRADHDTKRDSAFALTASRPLKGKRSEFSALTKDGRELTIEISLSFTSFGGEKVAITTLRDISDRKQSEEKLARSQESLNTAQQIAHLGSWDWNISTDELVWSDQIYRLFGLKPQQFVPTYDAFLERVHEEDRDAINKAVESAIAGLQDYDIEHRIVLTNGETRIVHQRAAIIRDHEGLPIRMLGAIQDVTEQRASETALKNSQVRFRALLDSTYGFIIMLKPDGTLLDVNRSALDFMGLSKLQVLGHPYWETPWWSHEPKLQQRLKNAIQEAGNGQFSRFEAMQIARDGSKRLIDFSISPIRNDCGEVAWLVAEARDITIMKEAEERLALTQKVFDHTIEAILITDSQAKIIEVNDAFCNLSGYDKSELIGKMPDLLSSGRKGQDFFDSMSKAIKDQQNYWQGEVWSRRKNGEIYPSMVSVSAVNDSAGSITHYVSIFADISAFKENEQRLEQLAHFDHLTGIPNRMLFHDRLRAAIARAKRNDHFFALLYIDLDGFKQVNDKLGHEAGDQVLVRTANELEGIIRKYDTAARLGGDEFAVILNDLKTIDPIHFLATRVVETISYMVRQDGYELPISASVGVALYPMHGESEEQLIKHADEAMYRAKQKGKNTFEFYDAIMISNP